MTDDRSLERAARSWLENGPTQAPDRAVEQALLRIQTTTQDRDLRVPWRLPAMFTPTRLAASAVLGALLLAGLIVVGGGRQSNQVVPPASPSASVGPTPSSAARTLSPLSAPAYGFRPSFTYQLPADAGIVVSLSGSDLAQFRIPKPGTADEWGNGIGVRSVTRGRQDPCTDSASVAIGPGPEAVVDYLRSIRALDVSATEAVTVDGKPALRFTMTPTGPTADCADLRLWSGPAIYTQNASWDSTAEVTVVDVGDSHIVILVFGDAAWRATAHQVIDSFDFAE
jgi:hypothetical protein